MTAAALREVGPRLRAARRRRDLTLDALARTSGIGASTLSRLESGKRAPNLELLLPITRALGIGLDELMVWTTPARRPAFPAQRGQRPGTVTVEHLSPESAAVQMFIMTVVPDGGPIRRRQHQGHVWCYVRRGRARLLLDDRELILGPGQAVEFDTRLRHGVAALDGAPVEVLCLFSRQRPPVHLVDPRPGSFAAGGRGSPDDGLTSVRPA